jgi:squalene synthase HpnC
VNHRSACHNNCFIVVVHLSFSLHAVPAKLTQSYIAAQACIFSHCTRFFWKSFASPLFIVNTYLTGMDETTVISNLKRSTLNDAYEHCMRISREHYENFPVGSLLIPKRHRPAIAAVYAFARYADDIVDEGNQAAVERIAALDAWREELRFCMEVPERLEFIALGDTIERYGLSLEPFMHLLDAFEQDIVKERYSDFNEVLHYCKRSADPVGRIILAIFGHLNDSTISASDSLCTGLQLANFWQDVSVDIRKPRIYIPEDDMDKFGISPSDLRLNSASNALKELMKFEVHRTRQYFWNATSLFPQVTLRLRFELQAIWRGGMRILDAIEKQDYDVLTRRPALSWTQYAGIIAGSIVPVSVKDVRDKHAG